MLFRAKKASIVSPTTIQKHFRVAREAEGKEDATFHLLRATHATIYMMEGGTLRETMEELGHSDMKIAVGYYQRIVNEHRTDVNDRLACNYLPVESTDTLIAEIGRLERRISDLEKRRQPLVKQLESMI